MPRSFPSSLHDRASRSRCAAALLGLATLSGCPRAIGPPPPSWDGGGVEDASRPGDRDGDGLCDPREAEVGSRPDRVDTDRDRLPDGVEFVAGFAPDEVTEPPPAHVAWLLGRAGTEVSLFVEFAVRGRGEDYEAAFEAPAFVPGARGSARDPFVSLRAQGAFPPEAAARVEPDAARIRGVLGQALLSFEVRFRVPATAADPGCLRGLPFQVVLKRSDGARWPAARRLLVTGPSEGAAWCPWEGGCL